mgnify:CR=1 FL=1
MVFYFNPFQQMVFVLTPFHGAGFFISSHTENGLRKKTIATVFFPNSKEVLAVLA